MTVIKRILVMFLTFHLFLCAVGCNHNQVSDYSVGGRSTMNGEDPTKKPSNDFIYDKYDLFTCMYPIWAGNMVYNETIMFVPNAETKIIAPAPLLYTPEKVLSVRSYDLKTVYVEGKDYVVKNGCIELTEDSNIPTISYNDYYRLSPDIYALNCKSVKGRYLKFGDKSFFSKQICVTYTHTDKWSGPIPKYQGNKLTNTIKLLNEKEKMTLVYNGDSIMEGCDASSRFGIEPKMPTWQTMVTQRLEKEYNTHINAINTAVGGKTTDWGLSDAYNNIVKYSPDLVILNFGINDGTAKMPVEQYKSNMQGIIDKVREVSPKCEFIILTNTVCNPDADGWNSFGSYQYPTVVKEIATSNPGIAVVDMYSMQQYFLSIKRYWDTTTNNINHPNDFFIRVFAQSVAQALIQDLT